MCYVLGASFPVIHIYLVRLKNARLEGIHLALCKQSLDSLLARFSVDIRVLPRLELRHLASSLFRCFLNRSLFLKAVVDILE